MIPNGAIVTYTGTWKISSIFATSQSMIADVSERLTADGLVVRSFNSDAGFSTPLSGQFNVTLNLQVENGLGFGTPDDLVSIIRHDVYASTGDFPLADSIPYVQVPGGAVSPTGQPSTTAPQPGIPTGCIAGTSTDTTGAFSLSCWFKNLTTTGFASVGVLALLAILGIGIFVFSFGRPRTT